MYSTKTHIAYINYENEELKVSFYKVENCRVIHDIFDVNSSVNESNYDCDIDLSIYGLDISSCIINIYNMKNFLNKIHIITNNNCDVYMIEHNEFLRLNEFTQITDYILSETEQIDYLEKNKNINMIKIKINNLIKIYVEIDIKEEYLEIEEIILRVFSLL